MPDFIRVAKTTDLSDPGKLLAEVDDRIVVIMKVGGEYFCLDDVCTHDGGPLSDGTLADHTIACPRHGAKFDIRSGKALTMPATVDTAAHEVKIEGEDILVRLCEPGELARHAPAQPSTPSLLPLGKNGASAASEAAAELIEDALVPSSPAMQAGSAETETPAAEQPPASSKLCEDLVREELKKVIDPELFVNIVDLGLIYNVDLIETPEGPTNCKIDMTMTSPMCPAGPQMIANSKQVLGVLPGMGSVEIKIVLDPPWTPDRMTDEARDQLGIF